MNVINPIRAEIKEEKKHCLRTFLIQAEVAGPATCK